LAEKFREQFVVDNCPGAGSTTGVTIAARANPDGYTVIMLSSAFAASAALYKLPYDPLKAIAPITMVADGPMFLVVHSSVKAANLKEFVELARAKPGALNYGSGGTGSSTHLATELFRQITKVDIVHVPYRGIGAALVDLLSGQIQFYVTPGAAVLPYTSSGRLRVLAVTSEQRLPEMPDLPAINEVAPGYSAVFWYGLGAPAGTPKAIIEALNKEVAHILKQPEVIKRLRTYDLDSAHATPDAFARRIARDFAVWSTVVKAGNIKPD
jgi:tripartite-type tricarboxylate transporter receptor subunit TctC